MMYEELLIGLRGHAKRGECDKRCPSYGAKNRGYATCSEELAEKAAAAIEELKQTVEHYKGCADDWYKEACDYKAMLPRWIPVAERLPEHEYGESTSVLTVDLYGVMRVTYFDGSNWCWPSGEALTTMRVAPITHWMPLPEPPKEET